MRTRTSLIALQTTSSGAWTSCTDTERIHPPGVSINLSTGDPFLNASAEASIFTPICEGGRREYFSRTPVCGCGFDGSAASHTAASDTASRQAARVSIPLGAGVGRCEVSAHRNSANMTKAQRVTNLCEPVPKVQARQTSCIFGPLCVACAESDVPGHGEQLRRSLDGHHGWR